MEEYSSDMQGDKPVVLNFFTEGCQPCKMMTPILQLVRARVGERAIILNIDIEKEPAMAERHKIAAVPSVIILHHGRVVWRKNGMVPAHEILEQLQLTIT